MVQPPNSNDTVQPPQEGDPSPQPEVTDDQRPKRWRWIGAVLAALAAGFVIGAVSVPPDEAVSVDADNAAAQHVDDESEDPELADDKQQLDDRSAELDKRDAALDKRKEKLDKRDKRLNTFEEKLDERKTKLDEREDAIDDAEIGVDDEDEPAPVAENEIAEGAIPGNGVYLVGQDVPAGSYTTSGPEEPGFSCYYAFMDGVGADGEILDNQLMDGQSRVTLTDGQVFETKRCADWQRE